MIDVLIDAARPKSPFRRVEAENKPKLSRNDSSPEAADAAVERATAETLAALVPGVVAGLVIGAVIAAPQPTRGLREIADAAGCGLADAVALDLAPVPGASAFVLLLRAGSTPHGEWVADLRRGLAAAGRRRPFLGRLRRDAIVDPTGFGNWARRIVDVARPPADGVLVSRAGLGRRSVRAALEGGRPVRLRVGLLAAPTRG